MSTTYGPTPAGFVIKPQSAIVQAFEDGEVATIDPAIQAGAATPLGQLNGVVGGELAAAWEALQTCYNGLNRDDAEGPALDNVGDLDAEDRLPPSPSQVTCACVLASADSPYLAGTLVCNVNGNPKIQFSNLLDVEVPSDGTYDVLMVCLVDGPTEVTSGTLTTITAPVTGWTSVTNALDAQPGALLESDPDYRERQREELAAGGGCTIDSIKAQLLQLPGMVAVTMQENVQDYTDPVTGLPPHSFQAIVWDGSSGGTNVTSTAIAQTIWNNKPSGAATVGTSFGTAIDSAGDPQTVFFTRSTELDVYMAYTVTLSATAVIGTVAPLVKQTIVYLSRGFQADGTTPLDPGVLGKLLPGVSVVALLYRAAALQVPGVVDVPNLALDFTASPTATSNLPVPPTDIAVLDTSRITVNGI